jgi:transcriptional regulator with XRE-family HTH domain
MSKDFNNLKQWLLPILERKQISVEDLARAAGCTRSAIYYYMSDRNRPTTQRMAAICRVLGVPLEEALQQYTERRVGRPAGTKS